MRGRWSTRGAAAVAILGLVGAMGGLSAGASSTAARPRAAQGGPITIGVEQEPDCADWIASCAGSVWGTWTMMEHTLPRVFDVVHQGGKWVYKPNILMASAPTVTTKNGKQVVTYPINKKAVWSDKAPITSTDFKYLWDQIVNGSDIYDTTGYANIASVDDSDPQKAVVTFSKPYAPWRALFGTQYALLPSHILQGKDRDAEMSDGYSFSGGPYMIKSWDKGVSVTLDANPNWYGPKPKTNEVVFKFITDSSAEFQAFETGQVDAIYPQPEPDSIAKIKAGLTDANTLFTGDTANVEAFWLNNAAFPFDNVKVRQAFAYAINRDAMVARLFSALGVKRPLQTLEPPIVAPFSDTNAFAGYRRDLGKVNRLMKGAGFKKNSAGTWEKGGKAADVVIQSITGDKRRQLMEEILQAQLKSAGFNLTIENHTSIGKPFAMGDYQIILISGVATQLEPTNCATFCSKNIPSDANGFSGLNYTRTNIPALDRLLEAVDGSADLGVVARDNKKADDVEAKAMISLPVDPMPDILLWSKKLKGVKGDNPIFAMFYNLSDWTLG